MVLLGSYHRPPVYDKMPDAIMSPHHGRREPELNIGTVETFFGGQKKKVNRDLVNRKKGKLFRKNLENYMIVFDVRRFIQKVNLYYGRGSF